MKPEVSKGEAVLLKNYCSIISIFSSSLLWLTKKSLIQFIPCRIIFCLQFSAKIRWMQNFRLWRANVYYWAAALSFRHCITWNVANNNKRSPVPHLLSHSVSVAGKASWHFQLREPDATLEPTRRGGSDTEQWASLQQDAGSCSSPLLREENCVTSGNELQTEKCTGVSNLLK